MLERIDAPFSDEQVEQLNRFQRSQVFHPFTCGGEHEGQSVLTARPHGWVCPRCDYLQTWAHAFMADKAFLDTYMERLTK